MVEVPAWSSGLVNTPREFLADVLVPGLMHLNVASGRKFNDERACVLLLAICMQESGLQHRRQIGEDGRPLTRLARGWAQFESGGGVKGVMQHAASKDYAAKLCEALHIPFDQATIHEAIAWNDDLAVGFARLLLWTDPAPLPEVGDPVPAWDYYIRNWRPGKPHHPRWVVVYPQAVAALNAIPITLATTTPEQPAMHMDQDRIDAMVRLAFQKAAGGEIEAAPPPPVPAAPATPPGQLTVEGGNRAPITVNLPKMNRSWKSGEQWIGMLSIVGPVLVMLSPLIDPALDHLASNPALAASPIAGALIFIARSAYKGWRVSVAASVAKAEVKA